MEMQGLKPSVLLGKLKQHLPPGVSPDNYLFLSMFLIYLLPSMREAVGVDTHETAADALWDAQGGHDPAVADASTQRSRSPAPSNGKRGDKRRGNAHPKSRPPSHPVFIPFKTLAMACVNFTIITPIRLTVAFRLVLGRKTSMPPNRYQFGGKSNTRHCHGNAFPRKCRIDYSHRRIDK